MSETIVKCEGVRKTYVMGKERNHLKIQVQVNDGTHDVIMWNAADRQREAAQIRRIDVVGKLDIAIGLALEPHRANSRPTVQPQGVEPDVVRRRVAEIGKDEVGLEQALEMESRLLEHPRRGRVAVVAERFEPLDPEPTGERHEGPERFP